MKKMGYRLWKRRRIIGLRKKIEEAKKRINKEIYKRDSQASIHIKLDDLAIVINDSIKRRGIAKGLVFVQEDLNRSIIINHNLTSLDVFSFFL